MYLQLASGRIVENPLASDIRKNLEGEEYTILSSDEDDMVFIQCAENDGEPGRYIIEYQDGSLDRHFIVSDKSISVERVLTTFYKYLRGDESWRDEFEWERMSL